MKYIISFVSIIFLFTNCNVKDKNFFNGEFTKITFSKTDFVTGERLLNVDTIGIGRVQVFDPFIILTTYEQSILTHVYKTNDTHHEGDFFSTGHGPNEFLSLQIIKKDYPYLWIKDYKKREVKKINVENGFDAFKIEKAYCYNTIVEPFNVFYNNDTCLLIKRYDPESGPVYISYNPEKEEQIGEKIVMYTTPIGRSFINKMLILADEIHPDGGKVVSVTEAFNQIDILDLKNPENNISVSVDDNYIPYKMIERREEENLKEYYFSYPVVNEDIIFVLFNTGSENEVEIHVIDWNGKPVGKILLNKYLRAFDIDFKEKMLYGIEEDTEYVYRFDLSECDYLNE